VLHCVFHICRLNRPRRAGQEKAVKAGIVRFLQYLITSQVANPLKEFAVPMICDFVQCSRATRKILLKDKCLETYLFLLNDKVYYKMRLSCTLPPDTSSGRLGLLTLLLLLQLGSRAQPKLKVFCSSQTTSNKYV